MQEGMKIITLLQSIFMHAVELKPFQTETLKN